MASLALDHAGRRRYLEVLVGIQGAVIAAIVGSDGQVWWRGWRVATVVALTILSVWHISRSGPRGRGLSALAFGIAGTVVGMGIGVPYAAKTGLSTNAALGVLSLVSGLALLTWSIVLLVRSTPRWWRLAAVPAVALLAGLVLYPLAIAVAATNVPPTSLDEETPADRGLASVDATYVSSDGVTLSGWYVPSENGAAVVLLHGAGSTRSDVLDHATVLAGHGFGVLLPDARGHGRSGGRAMDFGWYGDRDVEAAVTYLSSAKGVDPERIGAVGLSMGGEEAIGAAAADARIRAVVAEGATNRTFGDKGWLVENYGIRGWLQRGVDWVLYTATDLLTAADPPTTLKHAVAVTAPRPVLLIAAGDVPDEPVAGRWMQAASPATVELWVVPGSGHTSGLATDRQEWVARVTSFLDRNLRAN